AGMTAALRMQAIALPSPPRRTKMAARRPPRSYRVERKRGLLRRVRFLLGSLGRGFLGGLGGGLYRSQRLGGGDLLGLDARLLGGGGLALALVQLAGAHAGVLGDAGRLAATVAQVIELGAAHLAAADHLDGLDQRRIDREDALHALAVGNL